MFLVLTFWWITGVLVYLGCLSAISMYIFLIPDFYVQFYLVISMLHRYIGTELVQVSWPPALFQFKY
jgi:hypothetical protein